MLDAVAHFSNPYISILTWMVAPAFLVFGLFLTLIGALRERRRAGRQCLPGFRRCKLIFPARATGASWSPLSSAACCSSCFRPWAATTPSISPNRSSSAARPATGHETRTDDPRPRAARPRGLRGLPRRARASTGSSVPNFPAPTSFIPSRSTSIRGPSPRPSRICVPPAKPANNVTGRKNSPAIWTAPSTIFRATPPTRRIPSGSPSRSAAPTPIAARSAAFTGT